MIRPLFPLVLLTLATACAADPTVYPSLAPRPVEKLGFEEPAPPPPPPAVADPALDTRLAALRATAGAAARDFDRAAERAATLATAARGAAVGSDRWIAAQTAIAELDALRSAYGDTVGELDELASARAQALQPGYAPLERALATARETAAAQSRRIDALTAMLKTA
ncbi:hypothetical protein [Sphingomonas endophytica]|uniref:Lipoprotein n=1 Tax=Sphingomonas endophytica TaxID=869719 RepID=A0A147I762_9SPHN|nr:hypothetical protein [Sphingomonas endophytica]KTT74677.1 hypothetical protein NS334_04665 [Sphingomonas endophytica]